VSDNHIQLGILIVASLTLSALIWYALETRRLRIAAQDQLEALAKPCLTLWADLRDPSDAILSMHQAVGNTIIRDEGGRFVVQNIGNGVALNVRYTFRTLDPDGRKPSEEPNYFLNILQSQKTMMPEPVSAFPGSYELCFHFESIGGRVYRSTIRFDQQVLTDFKFDAVEN
jgi:hypothetical protein